MTTKFQRRQYEAIAAAFAKARSESEEYPRNDRPGMNMGWGNALIEIARMFKADNPNFDTRKFLVAAGVPDPVIPAYTATI